MKAAVFTGHGPPDVVPIKDVEKDPTRKTDAWGGQR